MEHPKTSKDTLSTSTDSLVVGKNILDAGKHSLSVSKDVVREGKMHSLLASIKLVQAVIGSVQVILH